MNEASRRGLGKGIYALIPTSPEEQAAQPAYHAPEYDEQTSEKPATFVVDEIFVAMPKRTHSPEEIAAIEQKISQVFRDQRQMAAMPRQQNNT